MADTVVKFVLEKLSSLLQQEVSLLGGVSDEAEDIKLELQSMNSFLKDADRRKCSNEGFETWVGQVRDVAYEVEDIIDEFMYYVDRPKRGGVIGSFSNTIHFSKSLIARYKIASRLQRIKYKVHEISARRQRYDFQRIEDGTSSTDVGKRWQRFEGPYTSFDVENIVGIDKKKDELLRWLTEDEPSHMVISVVGIGGLGKSTLVSIVYNTPTVRRHFEYPAWISVSQCYEIKDLLRRIIKEFFKVKEEELPQALDTVNYDHLVEMLRKYLQEKKFLIVLDDVWDESVWNGLNYAFPDCKCGSPIILTSRKMNNVPPIGSRIYNLKPLEDNEAWALFCKAFNQYCPQELELWARKIVKKCEGLPLAILAIGGLMSFREKRDVEWEIFYKSLRWELDNNHMLDSVKSILFLSFSHLPDHLKHCFMYCIVFPENFLINRWRLSKLWIAEGFVCERAGMTLEEVADEYMQELGFRSMLQVVGFENYQLHDLLREFALSKKESFCSIYDDGREVRQQGKARRLSIHRSCENNDYEPSMPHLCSFFIFHTVSIQSSLHTILSSSRLLRVLDLEGASIDNIPKELTNLFNLRYLNLNKTKIRELPKSLGRLQNLQALDVWETNISKLPPGIVKLQNLRYLGMSKAFDDDVGRNLYFGRGIKAPNGIWKLKNLQTLGDIEVEGDTIIQIGKMSQLKMLGITKIRAVEGIDLCFSIQKLNCLHSLFVSAKNDEETLKLESLSPPPLLQKLHLVGHLEQVPHWFRSLNNLSYLCLHWSRLREDPLAFLHALPNLEYLELRHVYYGQQLCYKAEWFPRLNKLWLIELKQLNILSIEEGALRSIQQLHRVCCGEWKMLPQGIEYLTGLQELYLQEMSNEFVQSMRGGDKSDFHPNVRHIPKIKII